ncbi:MAG TPA: hypothetical protein DCG83_03360 [Cryomorphaceae bacterium]|nr:hypothetical protein [Cryomorphaceae bacterium]
MKKLVAFGAVIGALFMTSCEPNGPAVEPATYPGDSLTVSNAARPLVIETTGAWCQYCPNGAEIMTILDGVLGDSVVLIANHVGDWFSTDNAASAKFDDNFPTSGVPNFYVNNTDVGQSPTAAAAAATLAEVAFGLEADVENTGTKFIVFPRVKALETNLDNVYMIQSYLLLNGVQAKDYGNGVDLNQVSSLPKVSTGSGATPTTWAQDAALVNGTPLIKSGTIYTHDEVLYRHATAAVIGWVESDDAATSDTSMVSLGPWGMNLGDLNPLGNAFAAGDVYGTRYTPMQFHIDIPTTLPFNADYSVATIVWELRQDGSGDYDYVNGVVTHVP